MHKLFGIFSALFLVCGASAQQVSLPEDLRQHNLTQFNANLLNPTFSYDYNRPHALSVWNRYQWQTIDADPTTIYASYTHRLGESSVLGGGFLQHNTGIFLNTGGLLNYTHAIDFGSGTKLLVGANVLAFQQELADDRFQTDSEINLPQLQSTNDFLVQFTPGARLLINTFSLALALENAIDINVSEREREGSGRTFVGTVSNDFPVNIFSGWGTSYIRPIAYLKTIANADTQYGINTLLSTPKFWLQGGYNNFYGPSAGLGLTFFKHLSLGGLVEFPVDSDFDEEDPTFELIVSYHFGKNNEDQREKVVGFGEEEDEKLVEELLAEEEEQLAQAEAEREAQEKAAEERRQREAERLQREQDSVNQALAAAEQRRIQDSITAIERKEAEALREKQRLDSIAKAEDQKIDIKPGEKFEEVTNLEGLEPGFYLIANVFGTKKYFDKFMQTLKGQGLDPKSFYRKLNGYNYVYLKRYDTLEEARKGRDSKFDGKYPDKTWVFRVRR